MHCERCGYEGIREWSISDITDHIQEGGDAILFHVCRSCDWVKDVFSSEAWDDIQHYRLLVDNGLGRDWMQDTVDLSGLLREDAANTGDT